LLKKLGVRRGVELARKFGLTTPLAPNLSISLGAAEVIPLELVRAYGAFAASGWLADSLIVTSIEDRHGKIVYQQRPRQDKIMSDESAFIMANMMKGVVENGTAQRVKVLGKPVAGKTGTTNDQMDAWFIGYTPEWVAGVWVGFDVKRTIGKFETGGKAAAPIFVHFMKRFLKDSPPLDFDIPDGVIPVAVNSYSGRLADPGDPGSFTEYFISGTEPTTRASDLEIDREYLSSDEF
jgi:penicillin-binding protein 1A